MKTRSEGYKDLGKSHADKYLNFNIFSDVSVLLVNSTIKFLV